MRHWYLQQADRTREGGGSRGGIRTRDGEDWALEIGQNQYATPDLFALAVLHDEIVEFLKLYRDESALAAELYSRYSNLKDAAQESLRNKG